LECINELVATWNLYYGDLAPGSFHLFDCLNELISENYLTLVPEYISVPISDKLSK